MKAWVRNSSARARSCQEIGAGCAFMGGLDPSEGRRSAGADDLTRLASDIAEAMRQLAGEIVSLPGTEHARGAADGELDAPADHDPGFLAAMCQHLLLRGGSRRVALVQQRQLPSGALRRHEAQRHLG